MNKIEIYRQAYNFYYDSESSTPWCTVREKLCLDLETAQDIEDLAMNHFLEDAPEILELLEIEI